MTSKPSIEEHWPEICRVVERGQTSSLYCAIASVGEGGEPTVTPVGTVFLRSDLSGFFFDQYTSALGKNIDANGKVCLLAVNSGKAYWLWSLFMGRFGSAPGVRLYGMASQLRAANPDELSQVERRVRPTRWLRGSRLLWSDFTHVRDIKFTSFRPVSYPTMMERLWQ